MFNLKPIKKTQKIKLMNIMDLYSDKNIITKDILANSKLNPLTNSLSLSPISKHPRIVSSIVIKKNRKKR